MLVDGDGHEPPGISRPNTGFGKVSLAYGQWIERVKRTLDIQAAKTRAQKRLRQEE